MCGDGQHQGKGLFYGKSFMEHSLERNHAAVIGCVNVKKVKIRDGAVNSWCCGSRAVS